MKKLFLSLVAAIVAATATFAQGSLLATLSHDGHISAFYGAEALRTAMAEAEAGDVITLSSGQFNAVDIDKPITLRGAGMSNSSDSISSHEPTIIQNSFTINIADSLSSRLLMEGIYFKSGINYQGTIKNAQFMKCRFLNFIANSEARIVNSSFIHCRFYNGFTMNNNSSNAYFINSIICSPRNSVSSGTNTSNIEFDNCVVKFDYSSNYGSNPAYIQNGYYKNCIILKINGNSGCIIPWSCTAYNCVGYNRVSNENLFANMSSQNTTNVTVTSLSGLFKTYSQTNHGTFISDIDDFTLTDKAAAKYLGTDGTQVGIFGGSLPYDEEPTIPQITKCNVASKSTADGKLSVDIEVKAAEY